MSVKAISWALYEVPDLSPVTRLVLAVLADHAGHDGTGAYPSQKTIAAAVGVTPRSIRDHIKALTEAGVIRRGDQRHVQHIPANYRPVVYDMCLEPEERLKAIITNRSGRKHDSGLDRKQDSGLGRNDSAPRAEIRAEPSFLQTNKPKDKPTQAPASDLTPVLCSGCDRVRPARLLTASGLCADCVAMNDPSHAAEVERGRLYRLELYNSRRAKAGLPPVEALDGEA